MARPPNGGGVTKASSASSACTRPTRRARSGSTTASSGGASGRTCATLRSSTSRPGTSLRCRDGGDGPAGCPSRAATPPGQARVGPHALHGPRAGPVGSGTTRPRRSGGEGVRTGLTVRVIVGAIGPGRLVGRRRTTQTPSTAPRRASRPSEPAHPRSALEASAISTAATATPAKEGPPTAVAKAATDGGLAAIATAQSTDGDGVSGSPRPGRTAPTRGSIIVIGAAAEGPAFVGAAVTGLGASKAPALAGA